MSNDRSSLSNGVDSNSWEKYSTQQVAQFFLHQYYSTMKKDSGDLWAQYTIGSCFAHAYGIAKEQPPLPLEPVQVKDNPMELQPVIQELGYTGCDITPLCFDVTGDLATGMLILVSGLMKKKGGAPMEFCQTFYLKREIIEGVQRKPVIEQDILRYISSNKEAFTAISSSVSSNDRKNQTGSVVATGKSVPEKEIVLEKSNGETSVKSPPVSFREEKEENDSSPNDDEEENEDDEEAEMESNSKEISVDSASKTTKDKDKRRSKRKNKKKEGNSGKKDANATEETKVNPSLTTVDSNVSKSSAPGKPISLSFRDIVGKNPNSTSNSHSEAVPKTTPNVAVKETEEKDKPIDVEKEAPVTSSTKDDEDLDGFKFKSKSKRNRDQNDSNGNGKSNNGGKDGMTDIRSVHIKFTDDEGALSSNTEQILTQTMSQFGTVVKVTSNYPQWAFVDFTESKAATAALNSTVEFSAFKIQQKTQKFRRRTNNKDGQNKGNNGNGQNGNRRGTGNSNNRFKRENGSKTSN